MTSLAPRAAIIGTQGWMREATFTTRPVRSTKIASIAKRMKNIVIEPVFVIRNASPSASRRWRMSPTPREMNVSAVRQSVARVRSRVRF